MLGNARTGQVSLVRALLPTNIVVCETLGDRPDAAVHLTGVAALDRAVPRRRREFATGRWCAARALDELGAGLGPVTVGSDRAPVWPRGVVGSITHSGDYRAAAVARSTDHITLGIDVEERTPLPADVVPLVVTPEESRRHRNTQGASADGLDLVVFCAKESVFKAWHPVTGLWLDFLDVEVVISPPLGRRGTFTVASRPQAATRQRLDLSRLFGAYVLGEARVATVVTCPAA